MQMPLKSQQEILYSIFRAIILNIVNQLTPSSVLDARMGFHNNKGS
jgi:hypothetical protein